MSKIRNQSPSDMVFYSISYIVSILIFLVVAYPLIYVVSASFSSGAAISAGKVILWPVDISLDGYRSVFHNKDILFGFRNSIFYTVTGTAINLVMTLTTAYGLSFDDIPGTRIIMFLFTFTMFFGGNMITNYMLIRNLHFINTPFAMIIPGAISAYNMIIARTFIKNSIPRELHEASVIDGCSDIKYYLKIVIPLSKPVIAVLLLFYAVGHWNAYFNAMIYLNTRELFPLSLFLKEILISAQINSDAMTDSEMAAKIATIAQAIQYAVIVVSLVPVMCLYPFIQKHFSKGIMLGSVKG